MDVTGPASVAVAGAATRVVNNAGQHRLTALDGDRWRLRYRSVDCSAGPLPEPANRPRKHRGRRGKHADPSGKHADPSGKHADPSGKHGGRSGEHAMGWSGVTHPPWCTASTLWPSGSRRNTA
ncbi:hypothetical protein FHX46_002313 [Amycolatopsis viridis]|uniref:Uncharacterized protein n=1 Tax=Amycolatopsis viridis TaxID=185678 RepID=A0ABX0ST99_9PSEU|nr:hypothetical protein [Amycolatopsis viridis]